MPGHVSENTSGVLQIRPLQGIAKDTVPCQNFHLESPKHNAYYCVLQGDFRTGRFKGGQCDS